MTAATTDSLRRLPFAPADADAIIAFCAAHGSFDRSLLRRLLLDLTSGPDGVVVIGDGAGPALVCTVIDRAHNDADAAHLETLGVRVPLPAAALARLVLEPALAFARGGERRALYVPVPAERPVADDAARALRDAGFTHAYDGFEMRRDGAAPAPALGEPLPAGWSWAALDGPRIDAAHAALREMFRGAPSFSLSPLPGFRRAVASGATIWRALLDDERIAGLVHIAVHGARGELRTVGRAPAYRGRGVGPRLVAEGLRLLRAGGAGDVDLSVEAANESALALYRRFGFEVQSRTPVFGLTLR
jgi:ribosomal protein S18 acetylase RimI-like enzyme